MTQVFELLFGLFESVIGFMKEIPLTQNVSLFDFSIAILVMSIIIVAFVPVVGVGSTNYVNETLNSERARQREEERERLRHEEELHRNSYEYYASKRWLKERYAERYKQDIANMNRKDLVKK